MNQKLEIYDSNAENALSFDMREVLESLPASVSELVWYLLDLEATADAHDGESEMELENRVRSNPNGLKLSWEELQQIATRIGQTMNAVLVALSPSQSPPSLPIASQYPGRFIIIEAIDSSLWAVTSSDVNVMGALRKTFSHTKIARAERM